MIRRDRDWSGIDVLLVEGNERGAFGGELLSGDAPVPFSPPGPHLQFVVGCRHGLAHTFRHVGPADFAACAEPLLGLFESLDIVWGRETRRSPEGECIVDPVFDELFVDTLGDDLPAGDKVSEGLTG